MVTSAVDLGTPQRLHDAARMLRAAARDMQVAAEAVGRPIDPAAWTCARADRFRADMNARAKQTSGTAQRIEVLAGRLDDEADRRQHELDRRVRLEHASRHEIQRRGALAYAELAAHRINPLSLPVPGHPNWVRIARALGVPG